MWVSENDCVDPAAARERTVSPPGPTAGRDAWNHTGPTDPPVGPGAGRATGTVIAPTLSAAVRLTGAPPTAGAVVVALSPNCQRAWPGPARAVAVIDPVATPTTTAANPSPRRRPSAGAAVAVGGPSSAVAAFGVAVLGVAVAELATVVARAGAWRDAWSATRVAPAGAAATRASPAPTTARARGRTSRDSDVVTRRPASSPTVNPPNSTPCWPKHAIPPPRPGRLGVGLSNSAAAFVVGTLTPLCDAQRVPGIAGRATARAAFPVGNRPEGAGGSPPAGRTQAADPPAPAATGRLPRAGHDTRAGSGYALVNGLVTRQLRV